MKIAGFPFARFVLLVFFSAAIVSTIVLGAKKLYHGAEKSCESYPRPYDCYVERGRRILAQDDTTAVVQYVEREVTPHATAGVAHMVKHAMGHEIYLKVGDIRAALALFPFGGSDLKHYYLFDGYQHGILQAFFMEKKGTAPLPRLIKDACGQYLDPGFSSARHTAYEELTAAQCFHGIGHALMAADRNDVVVSLAGCDATLEGWRRDNCRLGVFMENTYLYLPYYEPDMPRPFVTGNSILPLCGKVPADYRKNCDTLVGRAFLAAEPGKFKEAFAQCATVENTYRKGCVANAAGHFVPSAFRDDFDRMIEVCKDAGEFEAPCLNGVAVGIKYGNAGLANSERDFCGLLSAQFKEGCAKAVRENIYVNTAE